MKRSRLKTRKPLKAKKGLPRGPGPERKSELSRGSGPRPVNPERRKRLREKQFGSHAAFIRSLPCDLCEARPPSDPHHAKTRGAGGTKEHLLPVCRACHDRIHAGHGPHRSHLMDRAAFYWSRSPHNPRNAG